jgi:hypothetical protein
MNKSNRVTLQVTRTNTTSTYAVENIPNIIERSCKKEWFYPCYAALEFDERIRIDKYLSRLCTRIDNMGIKGAIELLVKLGLFLYPPPKDEMIKIQLYMRDQKKDSNTLPKSTNIS